MIKGELFQLARQHTVEVVRDGTNVVDGAFANYFRIVCSAPNICGEESKQPQPQSCAIEDIVSCSRRPPLAGLNWRIQPGKRRCRNTTRRLLSHSFAAEAVVRLPANILCRTDNTEVVKRRTARSLCSVGSTPEDVVYMNPASPKPTYPLHTIAAPTPPVIVLFQNRNLNSE